ncbi:MAG: hypothetical protein ACPGXK_10695 [Phycisphaerae bacterium]
MPPTTDSQVDKNDVNGPMATSDIHGNGMVVVTQQVEETNTTADHGTPNVARWWMGVVVAGAVATPLAWLLNFAASLPFFLGLFFFALFGLIIGATCYRVAKSGRPFSAATIWLGTTILIVGTWSLSIFLEGSQFAGVMAEEAIRLPSLDLKGEPVGQYRARVIGEIDQYMSTNFAPGGFIGYVRWAIGSGVLPDGSLPSVPKALRMPQSGPWWIGRVAVSIALLAFGVASQTLNLRFQQDPSRLTL